MVQERRRMKSVVRLICQSLQKMHAMRQRKASRRQLLSLSDHLLQDVGLDRQGRRLPHEYQGLRKKQD